MTTPSTPDPRKVAAAALDVFVYAPLGLALEARELVPRLAERGRNQVALARFGARLVLRQAEQGADRLRDRITPSGSPVAPPSPPAPTASPLAPAAPPKPPVPAAAAPRAAASATAGRPAGARAGRDAPGTKAPRRARDRAAVASRASTGAERRSGSGRREAGGLAIPGYDTLSASQVVPRLDALLADDLEAVRRYEAANRRRRTILNRIAQLQS